ncbi:MAG TPA: glycoside hydrolase family 95 protein [Treponemataceae bacterium]|mgnify:FL=1|nr:glycoside hydrolase family 95 protein [Treponemataceae bacterium]HQL05642.1 glycoside hydrolase family 95 protein [Treponemataceae bacterium]
MRKIWFSKPASEWNEALPLGNGRLGAMVYGGINKEIIQLNEDSLWSGFHRDRNNRDALAHLDEIRSLIDKGRIEEAQELCFTSLSGTPPNQSVYQTAGELHLDFYSADTKGIKGPMGDHNALMREPLQDRHNYSRELNLESAVSTTQYTVNSVTFTRECFISAPDNIIILKISADKSESIFLRARLDRGIWAERIWNENDHTIALEDTRGLPFCVMASAKAASASGRASVKTCGACLTAEYADEVIILIDIQTAFRCGKKKDSCKTACASHLTALEGICFEEAKIKHIQDYEKLFKRLDFKLFPSINNHTDINTPTNMRLEQFRKDKKDSGLIELYYHFSRYLLISSSREGTNPANLQGIWNSHIDPPWGSKYTININTQMNYWPSCMTSLPECELPLFDLLERSYQNGKFTARLMYGCNGFVAHHNLDLWGDTAPQDLWIPGTYWLLGAAWLATHIREHYEYTFDLEFLERYYYLMHDACLFFSEFLIPRKSPEDGKEYLVLSPSVSPENTYRLKNGQTGALCAGCEMDNRILEHIFSSTLQSAAELKALLSASISSNDLQTFASVLSRLTPVRVTGDGFIKEWNDEVEETEIGHRHISNLYGLFPGNSISPFSTPILAKAAEKTLNRRLKHGGGHTGWSRAWIINFRASLCQGNEALEDINKLLEQSTLPNLFDNHPPFQIDGNFGTLAGITRMIIQSRLTPEDNCPVTPSVEIYLLSALPDSWENGELKGAAVKGALTADISWQNGELSCCTLKRTNKERSVLQAKIVYRNKSITVDIDAKPLIIVPGLFTAYK